jgi:hypothetical protein
VNLFPRNPGMSLSLEWQHRCRAHRILDRHRAGEETAPELVRWALSQTGDLSCEQDDIKETERECEA